ncbi:MAG: hypothetical protein ACFFHD_14500 [Promethearchaeota archaeon]
MNVSGDYEKILEDTLKNELEWLEQEFELLFSSKKNKCSHKDIMMATSILDNVINNIRMNSNEQLLNLLAITLNRLERTFPNFF